MTFNELVTKIGLDKILHFAVGGLITSIVTILILLQLNEVGSDTVVAVLAGTVVTLMLSVLKEYAIDDGDDWKDILASVLGSVPVFIAVCIGMIIYRIFN